MNTNKITNLKSRLSTSIDKLLLIRSQKVEAALFADVIMLLKESVIYGTFLEELDAMIREGLVNDLTSYCVGFNSIDDFCDIVEALQARMKLVA